MPKRLRSTMPETVRTTGQHSRELTALRQRLAVLESAAAERQQAEATLRQGEAKYRALFEESSDAIYITSREGTILEVNQALLDLMNYTRAEVICLNSRQTYANPADRFRFQEAIERQGAVRDYEVQLRKKDGTVLDCLMSATVRRGSDGSILGYHGIIRDITEQKRTQ